MPERTVTLTSVRGEHSGTIEILRDGHVRAGDRVYRVLDRGNGSLSIFDDGRSMQAWIAVTGDTRWVFVDGRVYTLVEPSTQPSARRRGPGHDGLLAAPMPATVRRVLVAAGDVVGAGDTLMILEAMKMELPVRASAAGTVRSVLCARGELVQPGVTLIDVEASAQAG